MRKFINVIYMQKRTLQFISCMLIILMGVGVLPVQAFSLLSENPVHPVNHCKILPTQTVINPYRYCGEQYDADLHMYFLRARYMETDRGRFWTMDSYQGRNHDPTTLHKYLYCHADPVNGIDPSGEMTLVEAVAVGSIMGASYYFALQSLQSDIQTQEVLYNHNYNVLYEAGTLVDDFYAQINKSLNETKKYTISELRSMYLYGPLLDSLGSSLEAVRLLGFAKNFDEAMALPGDIKSVNSIMEKLGYRWLSTPKNPYVGGNWIRPKKMRNILPPPHEAYKAYKKMVLQASK